MPLSIYTLSKLVDLQSCLRHIGILQESQWHPHQMALDQIQLPLDLLYGHAWVIKMALLMGYLIRVIRVIWIRRLVRGILDIVRACAGMLVVFMLMVLLIVDLSLE